MAYTRTTWVNGSGGGTPISAANLNNIETWIDAADEKVVVAKRSTNLAVTTSTWTLLTLNAEDVDTDVMHDNSTNPARLIAKTAGKYQFHVGVVMESNGTGIRAVFVQKNSEALPATPATGVVKGAATMAAPTGIRAYLSASGVVDMAVNDYLAAVVFQSSGGNLNVEVDTYFSMARIA